MWITRRKWDDLAKRLSALEQKEQERIDKEKRIKEHGDEELEKVKKLLGFGSR